MSLFNRSVGVPKLAMPVSRPWLGCSSRPLAALQRGNRNAGDFQIHGTEMGAAGEVKRSPVIAAERDVGGRRLPVHDAAELLALRVEDPDAARAAAIDVAGRVDLHAVGD